MSTSALSEKNVVFVHELCTFSTSGLLESDLYEEPFRRSHTLNILKLTEVGENYWKGCSENKFVENFFNNIAYAVRVQN